MRQLSRYVVSVIGAGGLVAGVLTNAFASHPTPLKVAQAGRNLTVPGNLQVNGVIRGNTNETLKKNFYVRGKAEIYKGLTLRDAGLTVNTGGINVKAGGVTADSLTTTGAAQAGSLTVTGAAQAGSLNVTGASTFGGTIAATGQITGNGMNAGSGAITTTGNLNAGAASVSSLTDTGSMVTGNLAVTGTADFTHATVTGLSLSNIVGTGNLTLQSLTVGTPTGNTPPLSLASNGKTVSIGVSSAGDIQLPALATAGDATIGGNLSVAGSTGITAGAITTSSLTSPLTTGTSPTLTPLAIKGSTITLTGATTLASSLTANGATTFNAAATVAGNNDLTLATAAASGSNAATASHLVGNPDVAGRVTVNVPALATSEQTSGTVAFTRPYTTQPTIVVTPTEDPAPWGTAAPRVWITLHTTATGLYDGFILHYVSPAPGPAAATAITYNYHVIG